MTGRSAPTLNLGQSEMTATALPRPDYARNMRLVGYSDQGGRPDGVQIMVQDG
jgi:hypothetical protein